MLQFSGFLYCPNDFSLPTFPTHLDLEHITGIMLNFYESYKYHLILEGSLDSLGLGGRDCVFLRTSWMFIFLCLATSPSKLLAPESVV